MKWNVFHLSEEFLRLCPGGIGFVPDPFTLVIKGEFEISLAATRVSESSSTYQVLSQKVFLNIKRAFLDASCCNRVLVCLVIFVSIGAMFATLSFHIHFYFKLLDELHLITLRGITLGYYVTIIIIKNVFCRCGRVPWNPRCLQWGSLPKYIGKF